ncbi:MAG: hypothetical protein EBX37_09780 [Alphaproteobacteria bacterium]|nr:hypothetical protein [Alphaproteobacteria bacterium]
MPSLARHLLLITVALGFASPAWATCPRGTKPSMIASWEQNCGDDLSSLTEQCAGLNGTIVGGPNGISTDAGYNGVEPYQDPEDNCHYRCRQCVEDPTAADEEVLPQQRAPSAPNKEPKPQTGVKYY